MITIVVPALCVTFVVLFALGSLVCNASVYSYASYHLHVCKSGVHKQQFLFMHAKAGFQRLLGTCESTALIHKQHMPSQTST